MRRVWCGTDERSDQSTRSSAALWRLDPVGHRSDPNAELTGDGTQGLAAADGGYHGATPLGLTLCLLMRLPRHGAVDYLDTEPFQANCSPPLFGTYWHETVRDVLALTPLGAVGFAQKLPKMVS